MILTVISSTYQMHPRYWSKSPLRHSIDHDMIHIFDITRYCRITLAGRGAGCLLELVKICQPWKHIFLGFVTFTVGLIVTKIWKCCHKYWLKIPRNYHSTGIFFSVPKQICEKLWVFLQMHLFKFKNSNSKRFIATNTSIYTTYIHTHRYFATTMGMEARKCLLVPLWDVSLADYLGDGIQYIIIIISTTRAKQQVHS